MLNKEFKRKDVERMRNLINGKAGSSSEIQIGYTKTTKEYKEGDIWVEGKKTWTIKNGIKKTISKLNLLKKEIFTPLCCPKCSKKIKHPLDKSNYKVHKKCHDCVIEFEHKLKIRGKYDDYIKKLKAKNSLDIISETELYLLDIVNTSNKGFVSEDGVIERWKGGVNKDKFTKKIKEAAKIRHKHIQQELNEQK